MSLSFFLFNFPIIVCNIYFFNIYTSPTFLHHLHFHLPLLLQYFSLHYLFIFPLPSILISFFLFPFIFLYFCLFLFILSYYKFVTISSILFIVFLTKQRFSLSLSLSHTHTRMIWYLFYDAS